MFNGPRITETIKYIIIINLILFIPRGASELLGQPLWIDNLLIYLFSVTPAAVVENLFIWQIFTYQFFHGDFLHILFNMFLLWMFGSQLEEVWGSKEFLRYYLFCGTGAGLIIFVWNLFFANPLVPTLGASGALYGVMLAYAVYWPDRELLLMMVFPLKTKYVIAIYAAISFFSMMGGSGGGISHVGHLGGFIAGFIYLHFFRNIGVFKALNFGGSASSFAQTMQVKKQRALWNRRKREYEQEQEEAHRVDELLAKISREGINSLSASERRFLQRNAEKQRDHDEKEH